MSAARHDKKTPGRAGTKYSGRPQEPRFCTAKWEFFKLPSGSCRAKLHFVQLGSSPLAPPTTLLSLGNRLAVVGGGFLISFKYKVFQRGGAVSAAASGPAPRWGASRTDRSGNGDRRWTVATGDHRPPLYPPARGRSHLPVRVLRPSGARPGPTEAGAKTGAGRSPPESCAPLQPLYEAGLRPPRTPPEWEMRGG